MAPRKEIERRMEQDDIQFLLVQFVDIHGAAKVKMVPISHIDDVIDDGAGFAGAAVWGLGQGPHSHDMLARIDLESYTPLPWRKGVARFASDGTSKRSLYAVLSLAVVVSVVFATRSVERARIWRSSESLVADAAAHYPEGVSANLVRARQAAEVRSVDAAVRSLRAE